MGKSKPQPVMIDFATGESKIDQYGELREIQARLYQLDNPYVGNKRGILVDIADSLQKNDVKFGTVLDLFSGSGVVSIFFKLMGKTVISNDLLTSSYFNALAFCENQSVTLTKEDIAFLCTNNNPGKRMFVRDNYAHRFTTEECGFLDNYRANIDTLADRCVTNSVEAGYKRALAFLAVTHYILNRCFLGGRLNKGQVLADLDHRIAHDRNKGDHLRFQIPTLPTFFNPEVKGQLKAYNMDATACAIRCQAQHPEIELAYVDPPYGGAQSDYTQMFSFCEEYVYNAKIDTLPHLDACKKFVTKKDYENNFRETLHAIRLIPTWAISYNATSFKDIDGIKALIGDYKKDVKLIDIAHEYKYRKERGTASEYLIIAR